MQEKDQLEKLKIIQALKPLKEEHLKALLKRSVIKSYKDQDEIVAEGEVSHYLYAVLDGSVTVNVARVSQKNTYITTIGAGEIFGEAGLFVKVKRTASVISGGDSLIWEIHRHELFSFIKEFPQAGNTFLVLMIYSMLKKLREANQELAYERADVIDQNDIDELIAELL